MKVVTNSAIRTKKTYILYKEKQRWKQLNYKTNYFLLIFTYNLVNNNLSQATCESSLALFIKNKKKIMFRDFTKYEVYSDGRIWSYSHKKFLKPQTNKKGYQQVALTDNEGKMKTYQLHRVVYEAVTGSPIPDGLQVNHINEDKTDNRFFENLELVTPKENSNFGTRTKRSTEARSKQVGAFKDGELIFTFASTAEARRNGFNQGHISACCNNCYNRPGNNVYKGYNWKYI